jgi:hypothetical protein
MNQVSYEIPKNHEVTGLIVDVIPLSPYPLIPISEASGIFQIVCLHRHLDTSKKNPRVTIQKEVEPHGFPMKIIYFHGGVSTFFHTWCVLICPKSEAVR